MRWARQITNKAYNTTYKIARSDSVHNVCGLGGQYNQPLIKSWNSVYDDTHSLQKIDWSKQELILSGKEQLFFGYVGPLESWCEKYLTGDFALWTDDQNVYLLLINEYDRTYVGLKWGGKLPHFNALADEFLG